MFVLIIITLENSQDCNWTRRSINAKSKNKIYVNFHVTNIFKAISCVNSTFLVKFQKPEPKNYNFLVLWNFSYKIIRFLPHQHKFYYPYVHVNFMKFYKNMICMCDVFQSHFRRFGLQVNKLSIGLAYVHRLSIYTYIHRSSTIFMKMGYKKL